MRKHNLVKILCALIACLGISLPVLAGEVTLSLTVSGEIAGAPEWQNSQGSAIDLLDFAFSGVAGIDEAVDVKSAPVQAKLVNATSYPASITLVTPTGCKIGQNDVSGSDIEVHRSGTSLNSNFSIADSSIETYALIFKASGRYGKLFGSVSCSSNGSMTYSY